MFEVSGKAADPALFEPFEPADVLYEFDGPRIFTVSDSGGELNLAYLSDQDQCRSRFVVVPTTTRILDALRLGETSVYEALNQPRCWVCDVTNQGALESCLRVDFEAIPREALPAVGTALLPRVETRAFDVEGRIREFDKDRLSFELREIRGQKLSQKFIFDPPLLTDVSTAFGQDLLVRVAGRSHPASNLAKALAVSRVA